MKPDPDGVARVGASLAQVGRSAILSECGRYRYTLERRWSLRPYRVATFYLCNPSTADATEDDHTVLKCIGFAKRWGCGALVIVNPCALRSRDPKALLEHSTDSIGIENPEAIGYAAHRAQGSGGPFVVGWGHALPKLFRPFAVEQLRHARGVQAQCLGRTADGQPRHPLMLAYDTPLQPWP